MKILIYSFIGLLSQFVHAEEINIDGFTLGGGVSTWHYEEPTQTHSPISFEVVINYELFDSLLFSARVGVGIDDDENKEDGSSQTVGFNSYKLLYLSPFHDWGNFKFYALLGYASYEIEANHISNSDVSSSGATYGAGLSYMFDEASFLIEWRRLPDTGDFDLASISIGFTLPY
ncbi:hypothetical protein A9Q77_06830 [Marinomonas sp. 42_23_T18]|nr:hypothetical protein A9Q77_06830 [Marinomonas sp. 42_23_T18]